MQLSIRVDYRAYVQLDADDTTVARLFSILDAGRFRWVALEWNQGFFVFSSVALRDLLQSAKSSDHLSAALKLHEQKPSVVVGKAEADITIDKLPAADTPARRAVVIRKNAAGELRVQAVGTLHKVRAFKFRGIVIATKPSLPDGGTGGKKNRPRRSTLSGVQNIFTVEATKKAGKKVIRDRFGTIERKQGEPRGFGFVDLGPKPLASPKPEPAKDYDTVEVFYATDREQKPASAKDGLVTFLNVLPDPAELRYGIASVTVPHSHKLGNIETPSIWRLKIGNRSKHFTLSACSPRSKGEFFKQLSERIDQSDGRSCFVFIHGYNVSFEDAAMRTAQLAKDLKFPGAPILYSWASAHKLSGYSQDEETVSLTIKRLTAFLKQLTESSGAQEIHLIAHSMGNRALIGALERLNLPDTAGRKPFQQVVLTAPDVPRKDVESLIEAASRKAERITLYASRKDKALGISKAKHKYERLGKVYGFPYVLIGMDSIDASDVPTDFLAHTVFAKSRTVLGDLQALIAHGEPPDQRFGLLRLISPAGICWRFSL